MTNLINPKNEKNKKSFNPNVDNSLKKANASILAKFFWYLSFVLIIPLFIHISIKNNLFYSQTQVNELSSGIDIQLKKRRNTLVKLIDSVKGYMKHEKTLFTEITKLRKMNVTPKNREKINDKTNSIFGRLLAVAENYPQLKSDAHVTELMEQVSYLEREIAAARRLYNSVVQSLNSRMFMFPHSVVSTGLGLETFPYFVASEEDKKDIKIEF